MCKKLPSDAADFVMEVVLLLTNLLQYHDAKVLEHASVCLTRIAEVFTSSPEKLDEIWNHGMVAQAASLISIINSGGFDPASFNLCKWLPLGAKKLLLLGVSGTLKDIFSGAGLDARPSVSPDLTKPAEQTAIGILAYA